ncbi:UPF0587 protein [Senna tora]|uniref:UPF0587 protein n=1 Tax=Senna tora TaxID=362788 RepID=A0A834T8A0_9FABA|nr:UPF0587 protein [Senna tora]
MPSFSSKIFIFLLLLDFTLVWRLIHKATPSTPPYNTTKCKFCGREGTVTMIPGRGKPLTQESSQSGKYAPLMLFDCRGYEPVDFVFGGGWKVESLEGTKFENVDLSSSEFAEYDEKGECPVMISNVRANFDVDSSSLLLVYIIKLTVGQHKHVQLPLVMLSSISTTSSSEGQADITCFPIAFHYSESESMVPIALSPLGLCIE